MKARAGKAGTPKGPAAKSSSSAPTKTISPASSKLRDDDSRFVSLILEIGTRRAAELLDYVKISLT